jgi:hypothetical protein
MEQQIQKPLKLKKWIWLTIAGWFIGVALVIGLGILAETILQGKEGLGGQALVGVGMGIGVGLMQWILLRKYLRSALNWLWFSILGFTVAYLASDIVASFITIGFDAGTILPLATFIGALISGWLQYAFVLKKSIANSKGWIMYNAVAWLFAHLLTMGMFLIKIPKQSGVLGVLIIILAFVFILNGGPLLGFITGRFLVSKINNAQNIDLLSK